MAMTRSRAFTVYALCLIAVAVPSIWAARLKTNVPQDIVMFVADDMGWNDVSFHGSDQILTPNIDALAYEGRIMHQYYTHPVCTPMRSALLTGHYASSTGMQGAPLWPSESRSLPRSFTLLPELLRKRGYKTHLVGKWHLGSARPGDLPTARGFDSHFGNRGGFMDFYEYGSEDSSVNGRVYSGFDFFRNTTPALDVQGYATDIFTEEAVRLIKNAGSEPLLLVVTYTAPHSGNDLALLQAPPQEVRLQRRLNSLSRRYYAAMVQSLDKGVGKIVAALRQTGRLRRSLIAFVSDNGAPTYGHFANWGSNWPLRGIKASAWEGGVRAPALIWSRALPKRKRYDNLFHVSDWLPTFYSAAGGDPSELNIDGVSHWKALRDEEPAPRNSTVIDIDQLEQAAAYREGNMKIIMGSYNNGENDRYSGDSGIDNAVSPEEYAFIVSSSQIARVLSKKTPLSISYTASYLEQIRNDLRINCDHTGAQVEFSNCTTGCLFDLSVDPCETHDLALEKPEELEILREKLNKLLTKAVPALPRTKDPNSDPEKNGGIWLPWLQDDE